MKFIDSAVDKEHRFSIGKEAKSSKYYLSIPVSNCIADYEEYYEIAAEMHDAFPKNLPTLILFAETCRKRLCDNLLLQSPGRNRGVG